MTLDADRSADCPLVSVCVANFNGEHLLDECLSSVYAQTLGAPVEILVHDDASRDRSLEVLRERHPRVGVIESGQNLGYCMSNNRLVERARGKYILLLNNDATLRPDALEALVQAAEVEPELSILTLPQYDRTTGRLVDRGVRLDFLYTPVPNQEVSCRRIAYVQGACMFLRRHSWERLGGFPGWMESNAEDTYLCLLARLRGGVIGVVEHSGYDHRQGTSFGGNRRDGRRLQTTYRRRYLSERNRACLVLVCTPTWLAWPWFAACLGVLVPEGLLFCALARTTEAWKRIYWPALRDSIRLVPVLFRARSSAQSGRIVSLWKYLRIFDWVPQKMRIWFRHGLPDLR